MQARLPQLSRNLSPGRHRVFTVGSGRKGGVKIAITVVAPETVQPIRTVRMEIEPRVTLRQKKERASESFCRASV